MSAGQMLQHRVDRFYDSLSGITESFGGFLRCEACGRVDALSAWPNAWRSGWPKCHGQTMRWWTRADAATPGPWRPDGAYLAAIADRPDAEFIAHAREDIPALLAALRERDEALRQLAALHVESYELQSYAYCSGCGVERDWPCETRRILDGLGASHE